ncbi:MAG TPA: FkbM family methyltransferase, partial [Ferruginibacter sp.]|nr:FkbM family methyltransferase [Ferruginibacter sp.]
MNIHPGKHKGLDAVKNFARLFFKNPAGEKFLQNNIIKNPSSTWKKFIPPHYLYKPGSSRETTINGVHYSFDISNQVDHYIYFGQTEPGYKTMETDIKRAKIILDIGANNATSSLFFANLNPGAVIIAFEPYPGNYKNALKNIALNSFANIEMFNVGLGDVNGSFQMYEVDPANNGMNRIIPVNNHYSCSEVRIITLDSFMAHHNIAGISVAKIDVEGYEYNVLKGGEQVIKKYLPLLFIELDDDNLKNNNASATELISLLGEYGYRNIRRADDLADVSPGDDFNHCHYDIIAT